MFEYPEVLSTKEDYFNMLEYDREETIRRLKLLLNDRYIQVGTSEDSGEFETVLNEYPVAHSLGFTFEEIERLVAGEDNVNDI